MGCRGMAPQNRMGFGRDVFALDTRYGANPALLRHIALYDSFGGVTLHFHTGG